MKGFKDFLMRGNLIELATAFIMAGAFAAVVTSFTKIVMDVIGKFGGNPDFSTVAILDVNVGVFITAVVSFVIIAAVLYFLVITPYNKIRELGAKADAEEAVAEPTTAELLMEIRDVLKVKN